jgi:serine/threonine-protein kinase OSR1/STK39
LYRKLISECLKKDPDDRPTAKQLLKHDFFKKAKDKPFIVKHLTLSSEVRNAKIKRNIQVPSSIRSGRWKKGDDGEWIFDTSDSEEKNKNNKSDDDDDDSDSGNDQATIHCEKVKPSHKSSLSETSQSQRISISNNDETVAASSVLNPNNQGGQKSKLNNEQQQQQKTSSNEETINNNSSSTSTTQPPSIHLVLRIRDERKELQDIKFDFLPNKDTVEEISNELVNAHLIDSIDMGVGRFFFC